MAFSSSGFALSDNKPGQDMGVWGQRGIHTYRCAGRLAHKIGTLLPQVGWKPKFAQIYMFGGTEMEEAQRRQEAAGPRRREGEADVAERDGLRPGILLRLRRVMERVNPYYRAFKTAKEILDEHPEDPRAEEVRLRARGRVDPAIEHEVVVLDPSVTGEDRRRYNMPVTNEVAAIYLGDEDAENSGRDLVVRLKDGALRRIDELHRSFMPLHFALPLHHGEDGWGPRIPVIRTGRGGSEQVTTSQFFGYHLFTRKESFNTLHRWGRLFQEWCVDVWAQTESARLRWVEKNQKTLRADSYKGLTDAVNNGDPLADVGQKIVLPSSFSGSPRNMMQLFQDAMCIVTKYGKPDLFVTMTCNPKWEEITAELGPGQTAEDRPDLTARVFNLKLNAMLEEILKDKPTSRLGKKRKGGIFGKVIAHVYVIEFQKRGLPHAHILLILQNGYKPTTPTIIDRMVCAELPDRDLHPELHDIVVSSMVHNCIPGRCLVDGSCNKKYPRAFVEETQMDKDGYPLYRRRDDGRSFEKPDGSIVTNQNVVPYNPYLSLRFQCHVNVEVCTTISAVKYLFKYVYKGHDRASVAVKETENDEVKRYEDARWVSAAEAVWRILGFKMHGHSPAIERLQLHLPDEQTVTFTEGEDIEAVIDRGTADTNLTGFFQACARWPHILRDVTYPNLTQYLVWDKKTRAYKLRTKGFALGRVYFAGPNAGERFYLRLLLTHVKCPKSWDDLKQGCSTFKAAAIQLGLLADDAEWDECLLEAGTFMSGAGLRDLFIILLLENAPTDPAQLWANHAITLSDDCAHKLRQNGIRADPTPEEAQSYALQLIEGLLQNRGKELADFDLPQPTTRFELHPPGSRLIAEETAYSPAQTTITRDTNMPLLNSTQRIVVERVLSAVRDETAADKVFFLDGPGGTGKTFVENTILACLRSEGKICLAVASSGIASILLTGGRTSHSRFKIPIDIDSRSLCSIKKNTDLGQLIADASLIIWDESPMQHRHCFEAASRTFQDLRGSDLPFGGLTVLLSGDFRQCLPVVPKGSQGQIEAAAITNSSLWAHMQRLRLTENMRLQRPGMSAQEKEEATRHAIWLLAVGDGLSDGEDKGKIKIPVSNLARSLDELIAYIYPPTSAPTAETPWAEKVDYYGKRAILAPTNDDVDAINYTLLQPLPGEAQTFLSANFVKEEREGGNPRGDIVNLWSQDYLESITINGMPLHRTILKVGAVIMLLRNLDAKQGLCNGTRLIISRMSRRVIEGRILAGEFKNQLRLIPRITLDSAKSSGLPFTLSRLQFPVRLAFAMTINKSQGQSVEYVGIALTRPVFGHGQLYVALSRGQDKRKVKVVLDDTAAGLRGETPNIVYTGVLERAGLPGGGMDEMDI